MESLTIVRIENSHTEETPQSHTLAIPTTLQENKIEKYSSNCLCNKFKTKKNRKKLFKNLAVQLPTLHHTPKISGVRSRGDSKEINKTFEIPQRHEKSMIKERSKEKKISRDECYKYARIPLLQK